MLYKSQDIDLKKYEKKYKIGDGEQSNVFLVEEKETGEVYAAKVSKLPIILPDKKEELISLSHEVNNNAGMNHPAIIKFIGFSSIDFDQNPNPTIILEYCKNGTLGSIISSPEQYGMIWDATKKLISIFGIASGMKYLHENDIIHRDLKPDNIFMDKHLFPKIADFGFSKKIHKNRDSISLKSANILRGTGLYLPPEAFETGKNTKEGDVYAFGMTLYEIMIEEKPYENISMTEHHINLRLNRRPPFKKLIQQSYRNLIERCWSQDPRERPTFAQIVEELKTDKFLNDEIDSNEYRKYVNFVDNYNSSFNSKKIIKCENHIEPPPETFQTIDIEDYTNPPKRKNHLFGSKKVNFFPADELEKLQSNYKRLVIEAGDNPRKQYYLGVYLIEGIHTFPKNVDIGVKYLEQSISEGNVESVLYLSRMLLKGNQIKCDLKRANKYVSQILKTDKRAITLYGKILKKENKTREARKAFHEGTTKDDKEAMYKYSQMLICGEGGEKNVEEAKYYLELSAKKGFFKSEIYLEVLNKMSRIQSFCQLPSEKQHIFIMQAIKYYTNISDNKKVEIKVKTNGIDNSFNFTAFGLKEFIDILNSFDTIVVEISYPLESYQNILNQIITIKEECLPKMTICINISDINNFSDFDNYKINAVKVQSSVQKINENSFKKCSSLTKVSLSSLVTSIEDYAFSECKLLKEFDVPYLLETIKDYSFSKCSSLKQIIIPSSVTLIGDYAFARCASLNKIEFQKNSSIKLIGYCALQECTSLEQILFPSSLTSLGNCAFQGCTSLKKVGFEIPSSLTSIGTSLFSGCSSLTTFIIPPSVNKIEDGAFSGCSSLESIIIPSSITSIGINSFTGCSSLKRISFDMPSCLTSISCYSFLRCTSLTQITIPASVKKIESEAFYGCKSLSLILFENPSSLSSIEDNAFFLCESLEQILIPSSVTKIGQNAFPQKTKIIRI